VLPRLLSNWQTAARAAAALLAPARAWRLPPGSGLLLHHWTYPLLPEGSLFCFLAKNVACRDFLPPASRHASLHACLPLLALPTFTLLNSARAATAFCMRGGRCMRQGGRRADGLNGGMKDGGAVAAIA